MKSVTLWACAIGNPADSVDAANIRKIASDDALTSYRASVGRAGPERKNATSDFDFEIGAPSKLRLHWIIHDQRDCGTIEEALSFIERRSAEVATKLRDRIEKGE